MPDTSSNQTPQNQPAPNQAPVPEPKVQPASAQKPDVKKIITQEQAKKQKKNLLASCLIILVLVVIFAFFGLILFLSQPQAQDPILKLFGLDPKALSKLLLNLINIAFGFLTFGTFILSVIGFFKTVMTKKDDLAGRRSGMLMLISGISAFFIFVFIWISSYLYLSARQPAPTPKPLAEYIMTEPASLSNLTAPVTVSFDANRLPIDTEKYQVLGYRWDFGDGEFAYGSKVSHTYKKKGPVDGRYDAVLKITAKNLSTNSETVENVPLSVSVINEKVNADFTATPDKGEAPLEVSFDATKSLDPDGEIVAYEWDFNADGQFDDGSGLKITHTFDKVGSYKVSLRVTDNNSEFSVKDLTVQVASPDAPLAVINHNNSKNKFYVGEVYTFEGSQSTSPFGTILKYDWDFGDRGNSTTRTANHTYQKTGNYTVTLEVTDETGKTGQGTLSIEVYPATTLPKPVITTDPVLPENQDFLAGATPFKVKFDASKTPDQNNNIVDYQWDFDGDGQIDATGKQASYTYEEVGDFTATLRVIDADNSEGTATVQVKTEKQGLRAVITADPIEGEVPLIVTFDASGSSYPNGKVVGYEWSFGDDSAVRVDQSTVSYKYFKVGTFKAQVTVKTSDGKQATAQLDINVRPVALKACFTANVSQGQAPLTVTFDPRCSQGTVVKYFWDFQGVTSREKKPTNTFKNPGVYTVTLEVTDNQNLVSKYSDTVVVKGETQ